MALIAVLWIVSALSIMVMGLVHNLRGEARLAGQSRQIAVAAGIGDAAIHIVLQEMMAHTLQGQRQQRLQVVPVTYGGQGIEVEILPLNGLINLNSAGVPLLAQMLALAGMPQNAAQALAQTIVDVRTSRDAQGVARSFEATEDLLQVPGIDYDLYAKIAPLLTADQLGGDRVNPIAAPKSVLLVLAGGDAGKAVAIDAQRASGVVGVDTTGLMAEFIENNATTQRFRLTARIPLGDGGVAVVARSVNLNPSVRDGMPWHTYRFEQRLREDTAAP
ncbi:type II secretion system protein GspK [Acidovorax sp. Root70]|uniref:type II secretion system protein GspK n=1 Tax=Acidovorax sp. Root70 TaxID=1736590 RepID=UPI000701B853|nr:type II secretion system protein GspK [Acidovorax sp. Root70]KRB26983.1 general secretion pathway protein GspK [Acidovorax sp. Root70]